MMLFSGENFRNLFGRLFYLKPDEELSIAINDVTVSISHRSGHLLISNSYDKLSETLKVRYDHTWEVPDWSDQKSIKVLPTLPERAVVLSLITPLLILPNEQVEVFYTLPMNLQICHGDAVLQEYSSKIMSNTWQGTSDEGELCYALHDSISYSESEIKQRAHRVNCRLTIINRTAEIMSCSELCVQPGVMNIYRRKSDGELLSDHCYLQLTAEHLDNSVAYERPQPEGEYEQIGEMRIKNNDRLLLKSFANLRKFQKK